MIKMKHIGPTQFILSLHVVTIVTILIDYCGCDQQEACGVCTFRHVTATASAFVARPKTHRARAAAAAWPC